MIINYLTSANTLQLQKRQMQALKILKSIYTDRFINIKFQIRAFSTIIKSYNSPLHVNSKQKGLKSDKKI